MEFSYSLISVSASAPKIPYRSDTTNDTKTVLYFFTEFTFLNFYEISVYSKFQKKGDKRKRWRRGRNTEKDREEEEEEEEAMTQIMQ